MKGYCRIGTGGLGRLQRCRRVQRGRPGQSRYCSSPARTECARRTDSCQRLISAERTRRVGETSEPRCACRREPIKLLLPCNGAAMSQPQFLQAATLKVAPSDVGSGPCLTTQPKIEASMPYPFDVPRDWESTGPRRSRASSQAPRRFQQPLRVVGPDPGKNIGACRGRLMVSAKEHPLHRMAFRVRVPNARATANTDRSRPVTGLPAGLKVNGYQERAAYGEVRVFEASSFV